MSIDSELTNYETFLTNAYNKCENIGAVIPANKNLQNLTSCIESIPNHIRIEYLESTGTQWIDTGFMPNNNTRLTMECQLTSVTSDWAFLFGARDTYHSNEFGFAWNSSNWYTGFNTADKRMTSPSRNTSTRYSIDKDKNVTKVGSSSTTNTSGTFTCSYNLLLFGLQNGSDTYHGNAKIYLCKIYDNGTLIRDYIPVLHYGIPCLYDKVEKKYYYNAGTGEFSFG